MRSVLCDDVSRTRLTPASNLIMIQRSSEMVAEVTNTAQLLFHGEGLLSTEIKTLNGSPLFCILSPSVKKNLDMNQMLFFQSNACQSKSVETCRSKTIENDVNP